jgi:hypothetical protein
MAREGVAFERRRPNDSLGHSSMVGAEITHKKHALRRLKAPENAAKMSVKKASVQTDSSFGVLLVTLSWKCIDFLISSWAVR